MAERAPTPVAALITGGLVALLALTGCAGATSATDRPVAHVSVHDGDALAHGAVLPTPYHAADVTLRDTSGRRFDLAHDARKPLTLVFFGYTNCPDVCQVVMATIASALTRLDATHRAQVDMVFVTTDPTRDTEQALGTYLARFDPRFAGLTGPISRIKRAGTALGVPIARGQRLASGGYDVSHGTRVLGLRPDGTAPFLWSADTSPSGLADDLTAILDDSVPGL